MDGERTLQFVQPWFLLILIALILPAAYWWLHCRRSFRRGFALGVRLLVLALVVTALARPQSELEVNRLAVAFTIDVSESVPDAQRQSALRWVKAKISETPADDDAAVLVFGDKPSVEIPFVGGERGRRAEDGTEIKLQALQSRLSRAHSDLSSAVSFAEATFPPDFVRRVVLVSDGNQTQGNLLESARALKAAGVQLDVFPILYASTEEVRVDSLRSPAHVSINEPFTLRLTVTAQSAGNANIQLYENDNAVGEPMDVRLSKGLNVFKLKREIDAPGYNQYEVQLDAERDGNPSNNVGRASLLVRGEAGVMVCHGYESEDNLSPLLKKAGLAVSSPTPAELPLHAADYASCDCLVLDNVAAYEMSELQMNALDLAVRELGMGLLIVGGNHSFGPGGYRGSKLERLLPVDLDIKNRKHLPKGALVIVLHSIEFDTGNTWAEKICKSALNGLDDRDDAGIVYYADSGEKWLFDLGPLGNREAQYKLIEDVYVGDMPSFDNCFKLAWASLQKSDAAIKHIVVISDGDPQLPNTALMKQLVNAQVTVSTICINPHGPADKLAMKALAKNGNGRFYFVGMGSDLNRLPALMLKESATLRRAAIVEQEFTPGAVLPSSPIIRGIDSLPSLDGYVVTAPRGEAETILVSEDEEDPDPILATLQVGLGRCTAFTSDASSKWAASWLEWRGFDSFWLQAVRATMSSATSGNLPIRIEVDGSKATVVVDANDGAGKALTDLALDALILGDAPEGTRLPLVQESPGRYRGAVEGLPQGHYLIRVLKNDGKAATSLAVFSVDFSEEYRALHSNAGLLKEAAELTGGRVLDYNSDPFEHLKGVALSSSELWPWLLIFASCLMVLDVAARRLEIFGFAKNRKPKKKQDYEPPIKATNVPSEDVTYSDLSKPIQALDKGKTEKPKSEGKLEEKSLDGLLKAKQRAKKKREWH